RDGGHLHRRTVCERGDEGASDRHTGAALAARRPRHVRRPPCLICSPDQPSELSTPHRLRRTPSWTASASPTPPTAPARRTAPTRTVAPRSWLRRPAGCS